MPQVSVLSTLLFLIFIDDITLFKTQYIKLTFFFDDVSVYAHEQTLTGTEAWNKNWKMLFNSVKCENYCLFSDKDHFIHFFYSVTYRRNEIEKSYTFNE